MNKKLSVVGLLAMAIGSLTALSFHAYLGSMSRFLADDYCVAYYAQRFGFLRSIWYWYISWSGTYSTSMVDWLLVIIKSGGIPFATPVVLFIWVLVTALTAILFLPQEYSLLVKFSTSLAFGAITVFGTLLISPDVPQSLYWWTGMRGYILPLVFITFYVTIFQWIKYTGNNQGIFLWGILGFGIIFVAGGFSETFAPVQLVFFVGAIIIGLWTKELAPPDRSFFFVLGGTLGALTSLIVIVAAPGNAMRQAYFQPPPGILTIFKISISAFLVLLSSILTAPEKIVGILGVFLAAFWFGTTIVQKNKYSSWLPAAILVAGLGLAFGCFLPAAWGLSDAPPDRNLSIPCFILVATLLITGFNAGGLWRSSVKPHRLSYTQTGLLLLALASLGYSAWVNINDLYASRQAFVEYAQKWDAVNRQIVQTKLAGYRVVHIPSMDSWTTLDKPNDNPKYWLNICYSNYYGVQVLSP